MTESNQDELLTPRQVHEQYGPTVATLAAWRCTKSVPLPYVKFGDLVRYRRSDLEAFVTRNTVRPEGDASTAAAEQGKSRSPKQRVASRRTAAHR